MVVIVMLTIPSTGRGRDTSPRNGSRDRTPTSHGRSSAPVKTSGPAAAPPTASYSAYKTAEDRATYIKQQAEQRMAERLAKLGLKPPTKTGETTQQRIERETREREERVRQSEAEDAKREQERQQRLADEQTTPPVSSKSSSKKPPPPPTRKSRADSAALRADAKRQADENALRAKAEQEGKEQAIRNQQQAQEAETKRMEYVSRPDYITHTANHQTGAKPKARRTSLLRREKRRKHVSEPWKNR